ncbi:hypothetical protein [Flavobacterium sp. PL12]|uniref:hypothetical protein n=1 Tax=Flavobacterium sp. PL12 TaxID=3071718 RepID=UPI00319E429D
MKIKITLQLLFILVFHFATSQTREVKEISGSITADSVSVEWVNIVNTTTEKATVSDTNGNFKLLVSVNDILILTAVNLETVRRKIVSEDLVKDFLTIKMISRSVLLKEVVVNEATFSAESLGIIPYGQKKYSAAERKLYTATSGNGIDGLLNTISGRKAMLKKEIIVEKKERLLARIDVLFEDHYYLETLKIPKLYIKGFQYYCVEDVPFANALRAKNKALVMFLIVELAETYNEIIAVENK